MVKLAKAPQATQAAILLTHYGFDLNGYAADSLVESWLVTYEVGWVRAAVLEALYQGRYKAISVEQILALWGRRGQPLRHFTHEFERIVCKELPCWGYDPDATIGSDEPPLKLPLPQSGIAPLEPSWDQGELPQPQLTSHNGLEPQPDVTAPNGQKQPDVDPAMSAIAPPTPGSAQGLTSKDEKNSEEPRGTAVIRPFEPPQDSTPALLQQAVNLSRRGAPAEADPIHEFVPTVQPSEFHAKLRAVAQADETSEGSPQGSRR
jgi:hypothetical protein